MSTLPSAPAMLDTMSASPHDVAHWRDDTHLCRKGIIQFNNAGAGAMPGPVVDAIKAHIDLEADLGGYEAAAHVSDRVEGSYDSVARLIGATAHNIAIVENATVAYAQALSSFMFEPGDCVLTTRNDYVSNQLMLMSLARRFEIEIIHAADTVDGVVDPESVRELIGLRQPRLVSVSHVPMNSGLIQPVAEVGAVCAEFDVPYLIDVCQSLGQLPLDVGELKCAFLCATARKFLRGPRGVGFLYVSDRALAAGGHPLFVDMRGARWVDEDRFELLPGARRFENWEFSYALVLGLGAAADYAHEVGVEVYSTRPRELASALRARLASVSGVHVLDRGAERCAIVGVSVDGVEAAEVVQRLRAEQINCCEVLRECAVFAMSAHGLESAVRLSPHYYNTLGEVERVAAAIEQMARN